jgi:hypothetical protein
MRAPFSRLAPRARWRGLGLTLLAMLPVQLALVRVDGVLRSAVCPLGIVSFELAGSAARLQALLDDWHARPPALLYAAFSLGIDYLFMPLYSTVIAFACAIAAEHLRPRAPRIAGVGAALAWGAWLAAACDAVENAALWRALADAPTEARARLALAAATTKFALVVAGLAYALATLIVAAITRLTRGRA